MPGSALDFFTDFVRTTGPAILTDPNNVVNDATLHTYFIKQMVKGKDAAEVLQGGAKIRDIVIYSGNGSAANYNPNQQFTPSLTQNSDTIEVPWRFTKAEWTWTEQEILLQGDLKGMTRDAKFQVFKNLRRMKEQVAWTDMWNFMETTNLWGPPDSTSMESAPSSAVIGRPYSIPAIISENTTTWLPPSGVWSAATIATQNPATNIQWRNQVKTYTKAAPMDPATGLLKAMGQMFRAAQWESPGTPAQYFTDDAFQKMQIACSLQGITLYEQALREGNDRTFMPQDAGYPNPQVYGVPLKWVSTLDDAAIFPDAAGTGLAAEASGSPRYFWLNLEFLKMIWHSAKYFDETQPMTHPNLPFTKVVYLDCYHNLFPRSRKRQGVVAPV